MVVGEKLLVLYILWHLLLVMRPKAVELGIHLLVISAITLFFNRENSLHFVIVFLISCKIYYFCYSILKMFLSQESLYKEKIKRLNHYIDRLESPVIDPSAIGLTRCEMEVLEALCLYRESNYALANRLSKSPNTVKVQLTSIMNKSGADTRHQLIDLCGNYFK